MIKLIEAIIDNQEAGELTTGVFLDLSKAFDCLGHNLIIQKLQTLGVAGTALNWFRNYLEGRQQLVELRQAQNGIIKDIKSDLLPVNRGVPQGSVLGPVLFILFTNDLPLYLKDYCQTLMYADDTTLVLNGTSTDDLAVTSYIALNMAHQYCQGNDLVVNPSKTTQVAFGRRTKDFPCIPDVEIVDQATFLGITIDSKLTWTPHLDNLCMKLSKSLYAMKRIKNISDTSTTRVAYYALFESHLKYGLVVWGGTSASNLQRILKLQKKAIRIVAGLNYLDSCRDAFKTLKIHTVVALYVKEVIMHVVTEGQPRSANLHEYNTRHTKNFALPIHHLTLTEKKPSYAGARLFNNLPETIKMMDNSTALKRQLNEWLLEKAFYSIEEFINWRQP